MGKTNIAITALVVVLIASNTWWAYRTLDAGITRTYADASQKSTSELLTQTIAILPVVAKEGASRSEVIAAARVQNDSSSPFEKEGYVWVGHLGLKFSAQGRFEKAVAGFSTLK